jgi:hypothetical protein
VNCSIISFDHNLLRGCEIVDTGMMIVPYPLFVSPNIVFHAEDVDYSDDDDYLEEEHETE